MSFELTCALFYTFTTYHGISKRRYFALSSEAVSLRGCEAVTLWHEVARPRGCEAVILWGCQAVRMPDVIDR